MSPLLSCNPPGAPHGLTDTHKEELGADLLAFLRA
jgi:non-heme chloroperoxidase